MKKTALILMLITLFSKFFGFARDITLAYFYGASHVSDAYLIALTIPNVIFVFVATGLATGYIPIYNEVNSLHGKEKANYFTSNLTNILMVICTILIVLSFLFTDEIVKMFASGFYGETLELTVQFTQISLFGMYFTALIHIYRSYLQIKGFYSITALIGLPLNFFLIISIFLSTKYDIKVLVYGTIVASIAQLVMLIPFIRKAEFKYTLSFNLKDKYIKKISILALPVILGVSVNQINVLVDRTLASQLVVGGITALNYANRLNMLVQGIFTLSIITVMYPLISKQAASKEMSNLKKSLLEAMNGVNLLVIPATVGLIIFAEPIIRFLFGRGAFDEDAVTMTSIALIFYSIGMIGVGLREVLSRAFYSLQDTKTPMINAAIAMVLNIILNFILSKHMGIGGLAFATSISAIISTLLLVISLRKKIGPMYLKTMTRNLLKIILASIMMGGISITLNYLFVRIIGSNLSLVISIMFAVVIYLLLLFFMKIKDVDLIVDKLLRVLKVKK